MLPMKKHLKTLIFILWLAFIGGHPFDLGAQTSVPVINSVGGNDTISNGNNGGSPSAEAMGDKSTLDALPAKQKGKTSRGFRKVKSKKSTRYKKKRGKTSQGQSGDSGSDGSQTEVSGQKDVSDQADNSKR
jgi:hypothetical protein